MPNRETTHFDATVEEIKQGCEAAAGDEPIGTNERFRLQMSSLFIELIRPVLLAVYVAGREYERGIPDRAAASGSGGEES